MKRRSFHWTYCYLAILASFISVQQKNEKQLRRMWMWPIIFSSACSVVRGVYSLVGEGYVSALLGDTRRSMHTAGIGFTKEETERPVYRCLVWMRKDCRQPPRCEKGEQFDNHELVASGDSRLYYDLQHGPDRGILWRIS